MQRRGRDFLHLAPFVHLRFALCVDIESSIETFSTDLPSPARTANAQLNQAGESSVAA